MWRAVICAFWLMIMSQGVHGQSLELPLEVKGEPGAFVVVTSKTDCATLKWVAIDPGLSLLPPSLLKDSRTAVVLASQPGRYRLLAYGAKGDVPSDPVSCTVIIGQTPGPQPEPKPRPEPGPPDPKPDPPKPTKLWLIAIEESEHAQAVRGIYFGYAVLQDLMKAKGYRVRVADQHVKDAKGETPKDLAPYIRRAKSLPYLAIVDVEGKIHYEGEPPSSPSQLVELLKKIGGD